MSATRTSHSTQTGSWAEQAIAERSRQRTARTRARAHQRRQHLVTHLPDYLALAILLGTAAATHGSAFSGLSGYVAAFGGVAVGALVALLSHQLRLGIFISGVSLFLAYLLFGGLIALPNTSIAGVLPTASTLRLLIFGILNSWKDLLTVQPPAQVIEGTTVLPYLASLVCSFLAVSSVLRTKHPLLSLIPIGILAMVGILWGHHFVPFALPIGLIGALTALLWAALLVHRSRAHVSYGNVAFSGNSTRRPPQGWIAATLIVLVASGSAIALNYPGMGSADRTVLRDYVEPPLNLREYPSPVSTFRHWTTTEKDTEFFTVDGIEEGERVRLATLDSYDGTIFQVAPVTAHNGFHRVGTVFSEDPLPGDTQLHTRTFTMKNYRGNWVPGIAHTRELQYEGPRARSLAADLHFSKDLITGLSTRKLETDDRYQVTNVGVPSWSDAQLEGQRFSQLAIPRDENVPDVIAQIASEWVEGVSEPVAQVRAIEQKMHTEGFFSDGTDGLSLPGHRADRLTKLLTAPHMIGDDDQYAPAMALMLRSLGIPSRLVMGFYHTADSTPAGGAAQTFTGKDTHMWVEVPFEDAGWVPFDPTPPRDQVPRTELPTPQPNPKPQVLQPPEPPEDPAQAPPEVNEEEDKEKEKPDEWWGWLVMAATVIGISFLVLLPFITLVALKALRTSRRRRRGHHDHRAAAAWEEVVDHATDLGVKVKTDSTRHEQARWIEASLEGQEAPQTVRFTRYTDKRSALAELAHELDTAIFGAEVVEEAQAQKIWVSAKRAIVAMKRRLPWHRRLRALFSTQSLRSRREPIRVKLRRYIASREESESNTRAPRAHRKEAMAPQTEEN